MRRREFLVTSLAAPTALSGETPGFRNLRSYFVDIAGGFVANACKTSPTLAVCDYPDGTKYPGACARSGKTYDSVTRILPALASWVAGNRGPLSFRACGRTLDIQDVLLQIFRNAFDPACPDYWEEPPKGVQQQRQVEASIVAWSLWLLPDSFLGRLSSKERAKIQQWLAGNTTAPVRNNNWAWFTAVNQAARLSLAGRWKEFSGDADWMMEDLRVLDRMAAPGDDGWYTDSFAKPTYDYYNFWVFASHFLYWNRMVGARYPEWSDKFGRRLRRFLETTPNFFGANGSHVLYGRSLIYRWAVLTPLVLAYQQKLWPHSPGLLRGIVRRNFDYLWKLGAFDRERGKLTETLSPGGNHDVDESYIDNGHPYWGMQAFAFLLLPPEDPFWTAPEEPLPVERSNFALRFEGTKMLVAGEKASGHVRWIQALSAADSTDYRDKYNKFSYSSHFPYNILKLKDRCPWDAALVVRNPATGMSTGRRGVAGGGLIAGGVETRWWMEPDGLRLDVTTRIRIFGEFEERTHEIEGPAQAFERGYELLEGSYALGLDENERHERRAGGHGLFLKAPRTGYGVAGWKLAGYEGDLEVAESFEETSRRNVNIVHPRMAVVTLRTVLKPGARVFASLHYASPRPMPEAQLWTRAAELTAAWRTRETR